MMQHGTTVRRMMACFVFLRFAILAQSAEVGEPRTAVGRTGPGELVLDAPELLVGMSWSRYLEAVKPLSSMRVFVPLVEPILHENGEVLYGVNAVQSVESIENIRNLSWALITRRKGAPTLIVDSNANGRLSDDPRIEFAADGSAGFAANQELRVSDGGSKLVLPVRWSAKRDAKGIELQRYIWRERRGFIEIDGDRYNFALRARLPRFDSAGSVVGIDLNRDGKIDFQGSDDIEVFPVEEENLAVAEREYKMSVERYGETLTLTPTGRQASARPALVVGTKAPTLPNGLPLSAGQGRPVLINLWSPHCSFSKRMAPLLRQAWEELREARFVSVTDVPAADTSGFNSRYRDEWPQIAGEDGKELFRLYRVTAVPTYYVVDSEGIICERGSTLDWPRLREMLARLSPKTSTAAGEPVTDQGKASLPKPK